eukprot:scaffold1588_cov222-Amphora_coffeaeformis.AAC.18
MMQTVCFNITYDSIHERTVCRALIITFIGRRDGNEALANEFIFRLTSTGRECLLHGLSATRSLFSRRLEFAHIFTVTLDLFLLGIGSTRKQGCVHCRRSTRRQGEVGRKGLLHSSIKNVSTGVRKSSVRCRKDGIHRLGMFVPSRKAQQTTILPPKAQTKERGEEQYGTSSSSCSVGWRWWLVNNNKFSVRSINDERRCCWVSKRSPLIDGTQINGRRPGLQRNVEAAGVMSEIGMTHSP